MRRLLLLAPALAATLLAGGAAAAQPAGTAPAEGPEDFACRADSWVAGTSVLCNGVLTYRDYVYDDYGADRGVQGTSTGTLAYPAGDDRYPAGEPANTADLVDLSLRVRGDELDLLAELNALYVPDSTVVAVAIDTDADESTGGGDWRELGVSSEGWDELHLLTEGDPLSNLMPLTVPRPSGERWRVQAVTADAGGFVMNVAFRSPEEVSGYDTADIVAGRNVTTGEGAWFEDLQAAALAAGDVSSFGIEIDVADLVGGATRDLDQVGPGLHERVYTSDVTLPPGEGMSYTPIPGRGTGGSVSAFNQQFHYFGRYQPYGLYLPDQPPPHALQMVYHGSNQNHSQLVNLPGFQAQIGEARNRILAAPLARGVHGYGSDISERDLLDVQADVLAAYDIDETKVYASGYSQGGYVTFRQSALYPDRFASFSSWVGFTGDIANATPAQDQATAGAVGNMLDFVGNYRHVRGAMIYGDADELVHATSANAMGNEFRTRDFPYVFYQHPTADHFLFAVADDWEKETAYNEQWRIPERVPRVSYRAAEVLGNVDQGLRHDAAYWISQLRGRESVTDHFAADEAYIDVDLTTEGCSNTIPVVEQQPGAGPNPVPWVSDSNVIATEAPIGVAPRLAGNLFNVSSVVVDVDATCLTGERVDWSLSVDGPTEVRFTDGRTIDLFEAGDHEGTVDPLEPLVVERRAGRDRVATALAISAERDTAAAVVLARADAYPDALAGAPLAASLEAPLLLTARDELDARVADEIGRLGAARVVLLGGEAALSSDVAAALADLGVAVERVAGATRFDTAAAVAGALGEEAPDVYVVEGIDADPSRGWPDAVAASALAALQRRPILLAETDVIPQATLAAMAELETTRATVVGGEAAVSRRAQAMLADPDGDGTGQVALHRISGATRYETSAAVADRVMAAGATTHRVWVATGADWPDALAAGPAAARDNAPLLLVPPRSLADAPAARDWLAGHLPLPHVTVAGGPAAVRDTVLDDVAGVAGRAAR